MAKPAPQFKLGVLLSAMVGAMVTLGACSLAPEYHVPATPVAEQFHTQGPWTLATPGDEISRDGWWRIYHDSQLDALQQTLLLQNPNLSAALAHYAQAQAYVAQVSSAQLPTVKAMGNGQRIKQSDTRPLRAAGNDVYDSATLGLQVDYEVDLWGRVRDTVAAGTDEAQASKADLASVQLSLQAQLADSYIRLRGLDQQSQRPWVCRSITRSTCGAGCVTRSPPAPMRRKPQKLIWLRCS